MDDSLRTSEHQKTEVDKLEKNKIAHTYFSSPCNARDTHEDSSCHLDLSASHQGFWLRTRSRGGNTKLSRPSGNSYEKPEPS